MAKRIDSLDLVRGLVMVLMAIDHVRVYSGVPAGGPTADIFFTRWVTHFCAPSFAFFAGTGAFLYGRTLNDPGRLARDLVTRGALLVVLEPTLIRFLWTFNLHVNEFVLAGVIWMLGWSMILLGGLVRLRLPARTLGIIGLVIVALQQLCHALKFALPPSMRASWGWVLEFIYPQGLETPGNINVLYTIVPWIGVMAAGFGFGTIVVRDPEPRRRLYLRIGLGATALFVVLAGAVTSLSAGDDEAGMPALFRFLSPPKYPASQVFLLMTLGPTIALLPLVERARGWLAGVLTTFGRVPMFYYLLHIPAIHLAALAVTYAREGRIHPEWYATAPYAAVPVEARWTLPMLYAVFAIVIALLYGPCRWYARLKARSSSRWLKLI